MGVVVKAWFEIAKQWLWQLYGQLSERAEILFDALFQRLYPLIEQLRPIWQDPLWQALLLILLVVLFVLLGVVLIRLLKGGAVGALNLLLTGTKKLGKAFLTAIQWLGSLAKNLLQKVKTKRSFQQKLNLVQVRRAMNAIQYLTTQREWRYHMPWSLLIGEHESGKTQLIQSVKKGRRAQLLPKEKRMLGTESGWHFFDHGVVIEPKPDKLHTMLEQLHWYRPERPVDNIILCVSAQTLLSRDSSAVLEELGEQLFQQLWSTQKQTGFVLPVYLFITQCDQVEGFSAFWNAQGSETNEQMIGWSNPYRLDTAFSLDWVSEAFEQLLQSLQSAQLRVAAGGQEIADIDRFMLFLHQFSQLQAPLTTVMKSAFARSSLQEALPLRGIYFCGQMEQNTVFVEDAFQQKVFAERNLSSILEKRRFSSNKLLRKLQMGTLGAAVLLTLIFGIDIVRIGQFNQYSTEKLQQLKYITPDCTAQGADTYKLLKGLSDISQQSMSLSMPLSWFDYEEREKQQQVAKHLLEKSLFVGLECRLKQRADALIVATQAKLSEGNYPALVRQLEDYQAQLLSYERNQAGFTTLAGPLESTQGISKKFLNLLNYLYDNPVPEDINLHSELIMGAIRFSYFSPDWMQDDKPLVSRVHSSRFLDNLTQRLQQALLQHVQEIPIAPIQKFNAQAQVIAKDRTLSPSSINRDFQDFTQWLKQTNADWLAASPENSPCGLLAEQVEIMRHDLVQFGFDSVQLERMVSRFSQQECDKVVRDELASLNTAPFGVLFKLDSQGLLSESPELKQLIAKLKAITELTFVKGIFPPVVDSSEPIVLWQEAPLQQLMDTLIRLQAFSVRHSQSSLFESALRNRVQQVTERLLSESMVRPSQQVKAPKPVHDLIAYQERSVSNAVISFKQVRELLLQILVLLHQQGDSANALWLNQQVQGFVTQQLKLLEKLVVEYHLYQPIASPQWQKPHFAQALFNLNDDKQTQAYLLNQRQQMSYFAFNYAQPLLQYLQNSESGLSDVLVQRWLATLQDLGRFERGEPNNQVTMLDDLVAQKLVQITNNECPQQGHFDVSHDNQSWFAKRRSQIEGQVNLHCASADKKAVIARYMTVANLFNEQVAGYFPFADVDQAGAKDIKAKTLKNFLEQYRAASKNLLPDINKLRQKDASIPTSWRDFIVQMNLISAFFNNTWQAKPKQWQVNLNVKFDALEKQAKGSNQIIYWALLSGHNQAQFPNGETAVNWSPGDEFRLDLRWAKGSAYLPLKRGENPSVDALTASFESRSQWGLFEWLSRYGNEVVSLNDEEHLLSFYVPVALKGESAHLEAPAYVSRSNLVLQAVVVDAKGEWQPFALPHHFPAYAPGMND